MSKTIKAMKRAISCIAFSHKEDQASNDSLQTIESLREAIAAEEAQGVEPVAWLYHDGKSIDQIPCELFGSVMFSVKPIPGYRNETPLFIRPDPPPSGQRLALILKMRAIACATPGWSEMLNTASDMLAADAQQVAVPKGWRLVPVKLTQVMRHAWDAAPTSDDDNENMHAGYSAMLAAAPQPPQADALAADHADTVRYCYECGSIGEVPTGKRDCCPDGSHAKRVHRVIAEQAQGGFHAMLAADAPPPQAEAPQKDKKEIQ